MCSNSSRLARNETCPRRHHISERRLPLRQPPAEHPFSLPPETWNPVRNGWVLPHFRVPGFLHYPGRAHSQVTNAFFIKACCRPVATERPHQSPKFVTFMVTVSVVPALLTDDLRSSWKDPEAQENKLFGYAGRNPGALPLVHRSPAFDDQPISLLHSATCTTRHRLGSLLPGRALR